MTRKFIIYILLYISLTLMFDFYRADLANLVNEAALLAGRKSKTTVDKIDFIQAVERSIAVSHILSQSIS